MQVQVKLNQQEEAILAVLPESQRESVKAALLAKKSERAEVVKKNREEFSISVNANGNLVIRGLGNRFPMGIRPDSMEILLSHTAEIQAVLAKLKA